MGSVTSAPPFDCPPPGTGSGPAPAWAAQCRRIVVKCPDVPVASARLRFVAPRAGVNRRGTIVLTTSGDGTRYYRLAPREVSQMVDIYVASGLLAVEVAWDAPGIWGGARARTLACRYATVTRWVYDNLHQATPGARFVAQGTGGGASQIAFGLAHYGLDDVVTDAHLAGGPPRCPCAPMPGVAPEPLLSGMPRLKYPNTTVRFFLGAEGPDPRIVADANTYFEAISSSKSFVTLPATAQDVENTREGQEALIAAVRQALAATDPAVGPARAAATPTPAPPTLPVPASDFQKGMAFGAWRAGHYDTIGAELSLENLLPTGVNWIQLVVVGKQSSLGSTSIDRTSELTNTDEDLAHAIRMAHSRGLRVMLKPGVGLPDDSPNWHGQIGTSFTTEEQWRAWFQAYEEFIDHYAELAERNGVELFSVGVELNSTTHRKDDWLRIIGSVRQRYDGPLTYGSLFYGPYGRANPPPDVCVCPLFPASDVTKIEWWDALDYVGVQVWPGLTTKNDPTVEELKQAWVGKGLAAQFEEVSRRFNKPVIFTEIGYRSADGTGKGPGVWKTKSPVDLQEQADLYQAVFEVFWGKPWLAGIYWWQWHVVPDFPAGTAGGPNDDGGSPYGKPAEQVLARYYQQR